MSEQLSGRDGAGEPMRFVRAEKDGQAHAIKNRAPWTGIVEACCGEFLKSYMPAPTVNEAGVCEACVRGCEIEVAG